VYVFGAGGRGDSLLSLCTPTRLHSLLSLHTHFPCALSCPCTHRGFCPYTHSVCAPFFVPVRTVCALSFCPCMHRLLSLYTQASARMLCVLILAITSPVHKLKGGGGARFLLHACLCICACWLYASARQLVSEALPCNTCLGCARPSALHNSHTHMRTQTHAHTHTWVRDMLLQPWDGCPCSCSRSCSCSCSCLCSCSCSCSWSMAMHWPADPCTLCLGLNHAWADALACCTGNRGYHHLLSPEDEALLPLLRDFQRIIAYRCAPACKVCLGLCNPQHSITFLKPAHGGGAACLSFGAVGVRLKCRALVRLECGSNIGLKTGWRWRVLGDWWDVGGPGGMFPEAQLGCTCSSTVLCECQHAVMCKCQHAVTCECLGHVQVLACSHAHVRCLPPGTCTPFS